MSKSILLKQYFYSTLLLTICILLQCSLTISLPTQPHSQQQSFSTQQQQYNQRLNFPKFWGMAHDFNFHTDIIHFELHIQSSTSFTLVPESEFSILPLSAGATDSDDDFHFNLFDDFRIKPIELILKCYNADPSGEVISYLQLDLSEPQYTTSIITKLNWLSQHINRNDIYDLNCWGSIKIKWKNDCCQYYKAYDDLMLCNNQCTIPQSFQSTYPSCCGVTIGFQFQYIYLTHEIQTQIQIITITQPILNKYETGLENIQIMPYLACQQPSADDPDKESYHFCQKNSFILQIPYLNFTSANLQLTAIGHAGLENDSQAQWLTCSINSIRFPVSLFRLDNSVALHLQYRYEPGWSYIISCSHSYFKWVSTVNNNPSLYSEVYLVLKFSQDETSTPYSQLFPIQFYNENIFPHQYRQYNVPSLHLLSYGYQSTIILDFSGQNNDDPSRSAHSTHTLPPPRSTDILFIAFSGINKIKSVQYIIEYSNSNSIKWSSWILFNNTEVQTRFSNSTIQIHDIFEKPEDCVGLVTVTVTIIPYGETENEEENNRIDYDSDDNDDNDGDGTDDGHTADGSSSSSNQDGKKKKDHEQHHKHQVFGPATRVSNAQITSVYFRCLDSSIAYPSFSTLSSSNNQSTTTTNGNYFDTLYEHIDDMTLSPLPTIDPIFYKPNQYNHQYQNPSQFKFTQQQTINDVCIPIISTLDLEMLDPLTETLVDFDITYAVSQLHDDKKKFNMQQQQQQQQDGLLSNLNFQQPQTITLLDRLLTPLTTNKTTLQTPFEIYDYATTLFSSSSSSSTTTTSLLSTLNNLETKVYSPLDSASSSLNSVLTKSNQQQHLQQSIPNYSLILKLKQDRIAFAAKRRASLLSLPLHYSTSSSSSSTSTSTTNNDNSSVPPQHQELKSKLTPLQQFNIQLQNEKLHHLNHAAQNIWLTQSNNDNKSPSYFSFFLESIITPISILWISVDGYYLELRDLNPIPDANENCMVTPVDISLVHGQRGTRFTGTSPNNEPDTVAYHPTPKLVDPLTIVTNNPDTVIVPTIFETVVDSSGYLLQSSITLSLSLEKGRHYHFYCPYKVLVLNFAWVDEFKHFNSTIPEDEKIKPLQSHSQQEQPSQQSQPSQQQHLDNDETSTQQQQQQSTSSPSSSFDTTSTPQSEITRNKLGFPDFVGYITLLGINNRGQHFHTGSTIRWSIPTPLIPKTTKSWTGAEIFGLTFGLFLILLITLLIVIECISRQTRGLSLIPPIMQFFKQNNCSMIMSHLCCCFPGLKYKLRYKNTDFIQQNQILDDNDVHVTAISDSEDTTTQRTRSTTVSLSSSSSSSNQDDEEYYPPLQPYEIQLTQMQSTHLDEIDE